MNLTGFNPTMEGISQNPGPYMWDYFRHDTVFRDRREFSSYSTSNFISISINVACAQTITLAPPVKLVVVPDGPPPPDVLERLFVNFMVPIPRECVVSFTADTSPELPEELYFTMLNIEKVHFFYAELCEGFLQPNSD